MKAVLQYINNRLRCLSPSQIITSVLPWYLYNPQTLVVCSRAQTALVRTVSHWSTRLFTPSQIPTSLFTDVLQTCLCFRTKNEDLLFWKQGGGFFSLTASVEKRISFLLCLILTLRCVKCRVFQDPQSLQHFPVCPVGPAVPPAAPLQLTETLAVT